MTTTWYILAPIDQICLDCKLSRCNDNDPRCPRRQALAAGNVSRRRPARREIQVLNYLKKHPNEWFRGVDLVNATGAPYKTITAILQRLRDKDKVSHTGKGHTSRWKSKCVSAKPSQ